MPKSSILLAKIQELTEAYKVAAAAGNKELATFYNRELIFHLWRLSATISNSGGDSPTNGGE